MLAAVLAAALALAGCDQQGATQRMAEATEAAAAPDQTSRGVAFTVYEQDRPRVHITAAQMKRFETEDSTYTVLDGPEDLAAEDTAARDTAAAAQRVTAHLFDEAGDSSAVITADRLFYYEDEDRYEARGRVVVNTVDGRRLESEHLSWRAEERRIRTPGFVRITTPGDRIQGYGLVATEDLSSYRLSNVTGETVVEEQ